MDFLVEMGRGIALYGAALIVAGLFWLPESVQAFLATKSARLGIALAGVVAILVGFLLATIGG